MRLGVEPRPLQPEPPKPLPAAYVGLLGRYHWEEFAEVFVVEWRDGELVLTEGDEVVKMEPTDDPLVFTMRGLRPSGDRARFLLGDDGRARLVNIGGYPFARQ